MGLPKTLYIYEEKDGSESYFCATQKLEDTEDGPVGVYHQHEILMKRTVTEVRRGSGEWKKP